MLFIHITISLLVTVTLLSLGGNFGDSRVFIAFALLGFATSWWQKKKNKSIPYLKIILNILFVVLTIKALLPFFFGEPSDILDGLIKTWIYFLILSTFTARSKRDYYLIQVFSFCLIIFSCFNQTATEKSLLSFLLPFFIIWIIALRGISLTRDIKEIRQVFWSKAWFLRELKIGIVFSLAMFILAVPISIFIPHFNIAIPFLPRFIEQKYSLTYVDFAGKSIVSYFGQSPEKLTDAKKRKLSDSKKSEESEKAFIHIKKLQARPLFWHSPREYQNIQLELEQQIKQIENEISQIDKQLEELSREKEIPQLKESIKERQRLTQRKEKLEKNVEKMQEQQALLREEYFQTVQEKNIALINEPEKKDLLKSLEEKSQDLEKELENTIKTLNRLKEDLNRVSQSLDEVRAQVYRQSMKTDAAPQIQKDWAKKEILEEKLQSLKREVEAMREEYNQYIQLIQEGELDELAAQSREKYDNLLQELEQQIKQIENEISQIDKQLEELSREKEIPQLKESIKERQRLTDKIKQAQVEQALLQEEYLNFAREKYDNLLQELAQQIKQIENEISQIDKQLEELSREKEIPQLKESIKERQRLTQRKEKLEKNVEKMQEQQALLREEYFQTVQEKNIALINEPEKKDLLKSLEEKSQDLEKELENTIKTLNRLKEDLNRVSQSLDEVRAQVYRQSMKTDAAPQIQKDWAKKEILEEKLQSLKTKMEQTQEQYNRVINELAVQEKFKKEIESEKKKKDTSLLDLLNRILLLVMLCIIIFLIYCIFVFFLPYLKEKNKFKKASLKNKHNLAIILLYNFLCRVLNIFGHKYPVIIDPEEYSIKLNRKFKNLGGDLSLITELFLEARYSAHQLVDEQAKKGLNSYRNILKELQNAGAFWQKLILKLNFVFKL